MKNYYVYIMSNRKKGTLYIGVTNNLARRVYEHKNHINSKSFTCKYCLNLLVYYEVYEQIVEAIVREKQMKKWRRYWKIFLIEKENADWTDLYYML